MRSWFIRGLFSLVIAAALLPVRAATADSLADAMVQAYLTNPTLRAARAGQRATDEQVPQALSGWRPTVTVTGQIDEEDGKRKFYNLDAPTSKSDIQQTPGSLTITLSQPLFSGFATVEGTKAAKANVKAGQQDLLATEQSILFNAVQTYMSVYSGRLLVALQQENVSVLQSQLNASNERFNAGEITRTDVEQSKASLSQAYASLATQRATLAADAAKYLQIIGREPGKLEYPRLARMPPSLDTAYAIAAETNPNVLAAAFVEDSYFHNINVARAGLLPELTLQARANIADDLQRGSGNYDESLLIGGVLSMPLYEAGAVYSQVRQAKQLASQKRIQVIEVARAVRQAVASSWSFLIAAREVIIAAKQQVAAQKLALEGVSQEATAGTRTTLDVLDAQAAVVSARTTLVNAERSQVLAAYQLLAAIGHLTARDLELNVPIYDPDENYQAVRGKWIGTGVETVE